MDPHSAHQTVLEQQARIAQLEQLLQQAQLQTATAAPPPAPPPSLVTPKPALPDPFSGESLRATTLDDWIFGMELYFGITSVPADKQVLYAATLLTGHARLWYRLQAVRSSGPVPFSSWSDFVTALKQQCTPVNQHRRARDRLAAMHQTTSVRKYSSEFMAVCLEVPDLSDAEQLDRFIRGLKPDVRREVELRNPTSFAEALSIADRVDAITYATTHYNSRSNRFLPVRPPDPTPMELGAMQRSRSPSPSRFAPRLSVAERDKLRSEGACFYCRAKGHQIRDCPLRPPHPKGVSSPPRGAPR